MSCTNNKEKKKLGRERKKMYPRPFETTGRRTRQAKCKDCGEFGHRSGSWRCSLTGTRKRLILNLGSLSFLPILI